MAKIYVGNLPFTADEDSVRTLFSQHGTVESVALPVDRETGRKRGFGFVEMPQEDAARAIQALNGANMGGRPLRVNEAQDRPRGGGGGGGGGGSAAAGARGGTTSIRFATTLSFSANGRRVPGGSLGCPVMAAARGSRSISASIEAT